MALATAEAIRDRVLAIIEALAPSPARPPFLRYRNEGNAKFPDWAQKNPGAALRRLQARDDGRDQDPDVSSLIEEDQQLLIIIEIAYPQTSRLGHEAALDRDDVMRDDYKLINFAIGLAGRANFSGGNDCTPLGCSKRVDEGIGIDMMVIEARFRYWRSTT